MELARFLSEHGIAAARHEHPPVMTVEESLRLVPKLPGAKTKNLFLRDKKGRRHFLVTVPYDVAVDLGALGAVLGVGGVGFASAERLQKHLGISGSVSLLGLINDEAHAVELLSTAPCEAEAACAPPTNTATMVVAHADLERFRGDRPSPARDRRAGRGRARQAHVTIFPARAMPASGVVLALVGGRHEPHRLVRRRHHPSAAIASTPVRASSRRRRRTVTATDSRCCTTAATRRPRTRWAERRVGHAWPGPIFEGKGEIRLDLTDTYSQFNRLRHSERASFTRRRGVSA
jgi:Ala-tRNA(Pro) deacylase